MDNGIFFEYVIVSTTHAPVIVVEKTFFRAIHKVYQDFNIVQDDIQTVTKGRRQTE